MKRYPSPALALKMHFPTLKTALKKLNKKNVKTRKIDNILETARNIEKSPKFHSRPPLVDVLQGMILLKNVVCSKLNTIHKVVPWLSQDMVVTRAYFRSFLTFPDEMRSLFLWFARRAPKIYEKTRVKLRRFKKIGARNTFLTASTKRKCKF